MSDSLLALFCHGDDFCQAFGPHWQQRLLAQGVYHRLRPRRLCLSEIMTILIAFHTSPYRDFKAFYLLEVRGHWHAEFPGGVSYSRFVELIPSALEALRKLILSANMYDRREAQG